MSYVDEIYEKVVQDNPEEPVFCRMVKEFFTAIAPAVEAKEELYREASVLERLIEPERVVIFRIPWMDDQGRLQINKGYRVQFSSAIGPYKGGLRFQSDINIHILKSMAFEQVIKNALTGFPFGGAKGGSNFDRRGKSDKEIMRFCQSFMTEFCKYIGTDMDIPTSDLGVGSKEIGYLYGQYKRICGCNVGSITGKGLSYGGSPARPHSTGYGLVYVLDEMMKKECGGLEGKTVVVSGAGNVAIHAAEKCQHLGANVVAISDSSGYIYDKDGLKLDVVRQIKEVRRGRIKEYAEEVPGSVYTEGNDIWTIPCDVALPCAMQGDITLEAAKLLAANGCKAVAEGAINPATEEAIAYLKEQGVLYMPGRAANVGGIVVSSLEICQDTAHQKWSFEKVDHSLETSMREIFNKSAEAAEHYGKPGDYLAGAYIVSFEKLADAMLSQGYV